MERWMRSGVIALCVTVVALMLLPVHVSASRSHEAADATKRIEDPVDIALAHLQSHAAELGVGRADVADVVVASRLLSDHSGVTHVNLTQRFQGLEVFGAQATVNVASDGEVLFVGDRLVKGLVTDSPAAPRLDVRDAVAAAADGLGLKDPERLRVVSGPSGRAQSMVVSGGGISQEPIAARLGWQATKRGLRLAWQLVVDDAAGPHLWNATVDAATGKLLQADDWTSSHSVRELASTLMRGWNTEPRAANPLASSDPVDDGSSYRVYALPKESPNDGPRTLVTNPADTAASPFGWHDVDGLSGPEFTVTRGNNAHAYADRDGDNLPDFGSEPDGSAGLDFDFPVDLGEQPVHYSDAAVSNLFYLNNVVHDVMYHYGFDEAAGNFQANNYGRGGADGDFVRAEAQDGDGVNNANFSTPPVDGIGEPRMQMFLWQSDQKNMVTIDPPSSAAGSYRASDALFGPPFDATGISGDIEMVNDGVDVRSDACEPLDGFSAGSVALLDRGGCEFIVKVANAQAAGAVAVIVANNVPGAPLTMSGSDPTITIPSAMIARDDGRTIKAGLPASGLVATDPRSSVLRDGDLDAGIVIHEYGHGVSLRLTGGPTVNCLTGDEQAGEGWSDYFALAMLLDPEVDDPDKPRGIAPYATFSDDRHGAGIRPAPYSRDMAIQPFTYDSIKSGGWVNGTSLSEPHGIGHGWAAVLWDLTWDLVDKHGFSPDLYDAWDSGGNNRALQYVIDGLKFQGCEPGLVTSRDAIIAAADALSDGEDTCTLWAAFARRGLGYSAIQGRSDWRDDNTEAFDTHPDCRAGFLGRPSDPSVIETVTVDKTVSLRFRAGGNQGLEILAAGSPYSRQVDCRTLRTVDPDAEYLTPRPLPVKTQTPAGGELTYDPVKDRYVYPWKTAGTWAGTCREVVVTRTDGVQHRAYFHFRKPGPTAPISGYVRDADDQPVANATVSLKGTIPVTPTTTDADGFYSFERVPHGTYSATAWARGCYAPQTKDVVVRRPAPTLNFTLTRCTTYRSSVASDGAEGNLGSGAAAVSTNGRYIAFFSSASDLVPGDTNGEADVFVHDRVHRTTERVSVATDGTQANDRSLVATISADGRYVAFESDASNLVPGDTNSAQDAFVHDRVRGTTKRVSVASDGTGGNFSSFDPAISANGRYVAFYGHASNLVAGDTNQIPDVFVHDRVRGTTERVSVASDGTEGNGYSTSPSVSSDGRYIAFHSVASNLVPSDTNEVGDVFVHDRVAGTTERVSVTSDGAQANGYCFTPRMSADGRYIAFECWASNLVPGDTNEVGDVFVHDRVSGSTERVSETNSGAQADGDSSAASMSANGRYIAFFSIASNLVPNDNNEVADVFVHDRVRGTVERVSVANDGTQGNADSAFPAVTAKGRYVAFQSWASKLVAGDTNRTVDIFIHDRQGSVGNGPAG